MSIDAGGLVLITGANGYIASHIADQLMAKGYRVRGTARDESKLAEVTAVLQKKHHSGSFEGVVVSDFLAKGAFDEAIKGVDGVISVATDTSFSPDPNKVVPVAEQGTLSMLESAARESSVKRFVLTSSAIAAVHPVPNKRFNVDSNSWNEVDPVDAWAPPPYERQRAFTVYAASKVAGEKAAWDFVKKENPKFVLNTVLPYFTIGPRLYENQAASTSGWVRGLYQGDPGMTEWMRNFPPGWHVDVRDVASTHLSALLEPDVQNERLLAFAAPYNYSSIVETLKRIDPSKKNYPAPPEGEGEDKSVPATDRTTELLKRNGRVGFSTIEQSLRDQLLG